MSDVRPGTASGGIALRSAARLISELGLRRAALWNTALRLDRLGGLVFTTIASANLAHLPVRRAGAEIEWGGLDAPREGLRPVRIVAVAESMRLPNETVRRRVHVLETAGLLIVDGHGCVVAPDIFTESRCGDVWRGEAAAVRQTCERMAVLGHATAAEIVETPTDAVPPSVISRLLLDFTVHSMETFTALYGDVLDGSILVAVVAANVRHITADPTLTRLYADHEHPPPDDARRPISVTNLARELELPFETVRRRVGVLIGEGQLKAVNRGLIMPAAALMSDAHRDNNQRLLGHLNRMLRDLARAAAPAA